MKPPSLNCDHQISTTLNKQSGKSRPSRDMTVHQAEPNEAFLRRNWVQYPLSVPQMLISECQPIRDLWLRSDFQVHLVGPWPARRCHLCACDCSPASLPVFGPHVNLNSRVVFVRWDETLARLRNVYCLEHCKPTDLVWRLVAVYDMWTRLSLSIWVRDIFCWWKLEVTFV